MEFEIRLKGKREENYHFVLDVVDICDWLREEGPPGAVEFSRSSKNC